MCLCFWRNTSHERERLSAKSNFLFSSKTMLFMRRIPHNTQDSRTKESECLSQTSSNSPTSRSISKNPSVHWCIYIYIYNWFCLGVWSICVLANFDLFVSWTPCEQTTNKENYDLYMISIGKEFNQQLVNEHPQKSVGATCVGRSSGFALCR